MRTHTVGQGPVHLTALPTPSPRDRQDGLGLTGALEGVCPQAPTVTVFSLLEVCGRRLHWDRELAPLCL